MRRRRRTTGCSDKYSVTLDWTMRHRALSMGFLVDRTRGDRCAVQDGADRLHPDAGHRADQRHHRSGAGDVVRRHGAAAAAGCGDRAEGHQLQAMMSSVGGGGASSSNTGRLQLTLKPRGARLSADDIVAELRKKLSALAGHLGVCVGAAGDSDRRTAVEEPVSVHAAGVGHQPTLSGRAKAARLPRRRTTSSSTSRATCRTATPRYTSTSIAYARVGVRRDGGADRERALRRLRIAPGLVDLHTEQRV